MGYDYFATAITTSTPSGKPTKWRAKAANGRRCTVTAQSWFAARQTAAARLGVDVGELTVERAPGGGT